MYYNSLEKRFRWEDGLVFLVILKNCLFYISVTPCPYSVGISKGTKMYQDGHMGQHFSNSIKQLKFAPRAIELFMKYHMPQSA